MKTKRFTPDGFIKPSGTFIPVEYEGHWEYCEAHDTTKDELVNKKKYIAFSVNATRGYDKESWISFKENGKPTQAQLDTLFDWAKEQRQMKLFRDFMKGKYDIPDED